LINLAFYTCRKIKKLSGDITEKESDEDKFKKLQGDIPKIIKMNQEVFEKVKKLESQLLKLLSPDKKYYIEAFNRRINEYNKKLNESSKLYKGKNLNDLRDKIKEYSYNCNFFATTIEEFVKWAKSWIKKSYFEVEFKNWVQEIKDEEKLLKDEKKELTEKKN